MTTDESEEVSPHEVDRLREMIIERDERIVLQDRFLKCFVVRLFTYDLPLQKVEEIIDWVSQQSVSDFPVQKEPKLASLVEEKLKRLKHVCEWRLEGLAKQRKEKRE